jgi:hypothetical protein
MAFSPRRADLRYTPTSVSPHAASGPQRQPARRVLTHQGPPAHEEMAPIRWQTSGGIVKDPLPLKLSHPGQRPIGGSGPMAKDTTLPAGPGRTSSLRCWRSTGTRGSSPAIGPQSRKAQVQATSSRPFGWGQFEATSRVSISEWGHFRTPAWSHLEAPQPPGGRSARRRPWPSGPAPPAGSDTRCPTTGAVRCATSPTRSWRPDPDLGDSQ